MVMVYVPAGEFLMGSTNLDLDARDDEKPQHTVYLDAFWIDKTEVTNAMFERFVAAAGYKTDAEKEGWGYAFTGSQWETVKSVDWRHPHGASTSIKGLDNHPVVLVTWNDARTYCQWAGRQLPTEAQWEKAARGTDGRIYPWGNQTATCDYAVMDDGSGDSCGKGIGTWPVGSRPKGVSPYGALDVAGNVWEWVADRYSKNYYAQSPTRQPEGPSSGQYRVLRGGGWLHYLPTYVRAASRLDISPNYRVNDIGFRCVLVPIEKGSTPQTGG